MPNGYPYFLHAKEDYCLRCNEPLCNHEKERENHGGGRYSYNYVCESGQPCITPTGRPT